MARSRKDLFNEYRQLEADASLHLGIFLHGLAGAVQNRVEFDEVNAAQVFGERAASMSSTFEAQLIKWRLRLHALMTETYHRLREDHPDE